MAHTVTGFLRLVAFALLASIAGCDCGVIPEGCVTTSDCPDDGAFCSIARCVSRPGTGGVCERSARRCETGESCDESARMCLPCVGGVCPDAGVAVCEERVSGAACESPASCSIDSTCQPEGLFGGWGSTHLDGSPGRSLSFQPFPGGYCAPGCDATRLNDECQPCAVCSGETLAGASRLPLYFASADFEPRDGVCRETCTPSRTSAGCSRAGYTCDLETSTCMEACLDDAQCQIVYGDSNGDGRYELIDRGPGFSAFCDTTTGRCRTRGRPGARVGDHCARDDECEDDGACLLGPGGTDGICTRRGCRAVGFECEAGAACDVRNTGLDTSGCMRSCRVGAEDGTSGMRGSRTGGHPDCGPGLACVWNGVADRTDAQSGSCVLGAYNDRTTPNIGAPCNTVDDCDSPFGYGECLFGDTTLAPSGFCTVQNCGTFETGSAIVDGLLPGVEISSPICDPARGEVCINMAARRESPQPYCLQRCEDASECAPGYACAQLLSSAATFCWPFCFGPGECRSGATCLNADGAECGPRDGPCTCSNGASG